jgi:hypothetical protein
VRRAFALVGLLASALAGAVGVSGCGGGGGLDGSAVAEAAQTTQSAGTARLALSAAVGGQTLNGSGFVDMKRRAADISLELPQGTLREITRGTRVYLKPPAGLGSSRLKTPWMMVDVGAVAQAQGINLGALQSLSDPSGTIDQLRSAGKVEKVGTETVRGVQTTHFKAVVDLRKAAQRAPAAKSSVDQLIRMLGRSSIPVEVWLDNQKRLRREQVSLTVLGQPLTETVELYDFGARQAIKPPPADQVTDVTKQASSSSQVNVQP